MISVAVERPTEGSVGALLRESDAVAAILYPGEARRPLDAASLELPGILVLVARADGEPAGMCALFDAGDGTAELKRMIVAAAHRRRGIGAGLLRTAEDIARRDGFRAIRMEVGVRNTESRSLYDSHGYAERGPFGRYGPSPISAFLEKRFDAPTPPPSGSPPRPPHPAPG